MSSLRPFNKVTFESFKDISLKTALKLLFQALMEKEEISAEGKKTLSRIITSTKCNYFLLDNVMEERRGLERYVIC